MRYYICIDIGGTSIKYGLVNENGELVDKRQMNTEAHLGGKGILGKVEKIVETYVQMYTVSGICISTAGMVDCEKGEIFYSAPLIPNYAGTQFKRVLEEKYGIPCEVENDVNCAGLAEYISGAAAGSKIAVCLTVGTGIGGCILINGKVLHGFSNSACEIGYMNMHGSEFQTLGATSVLSKKVSARKSRKEEEWSGVRIFEKAAEGDTVCIQAIEEMAEVLGEGIANICYVINPEVVVLGGGIMEQEEVLKPLLANSLARFLKPVILEKTRLEFARHGNDAGMLGAYYNFHQREEQQ